ncbi:MAG: T9SS type A sorting domain-containing protein [Bacteroidetes bacterium]|nr:T9SS type A sorting domain-containing protein [Bacteroidota bacterium]
MIDRVRWVVSGDDVKYIEKSSMLISPNPVNCCGQIIIFAGDPDAVTIDITDISGKKVISISATLTSGNNILNLPVSDFPIQYQQGYQVFYIRVIGNKTFAQTTFIKL